MRQQRKRETSSKSGGKQIFTPLKAFPQTFKDCRRDPSSSAEGACELSCSKPPVGSFIFKKMVRFSTVVGLRLKNDLEKGLIIELLG
jgi:hypothetical protein